MMNSMRQAIERLEAIVADESSALSAGDVQALAEIIQRKNHSLLELSRLGRRDGSSALEEDLQKRLKALRSLLEENSRLLELHLRASRNLASMIAETITARDSDGTYSAPMGQRRSA